MTQVNNLYRQIAPAGAEGSDRRGSDNLFTLSVSSTLKETHMRRSHSKFWKVANMRNEARSTGVKTEVVESYG